ncbi:unnamed protein product [Arabidopsis thaliana]|uniref:Uncharacterized protein n=2 Tax=Arabidopsis thaliana TaxID=3702 RepID=A0A654FCE1_ARATH|nr:uncharacterized protein AT3G27809 [Arabidopsis thaliana]AEE77365.1 hypothetical protein AT3G27809 [Arabidopsis thaliana]BAF00385.1 hypothetical protein [Arabidopsis thaliana]CAA0383925.1 unnamed protein product [Arabidopsis thaliana]VYS58840.1 unnamed protein product [Arabidopsis thaliana]|eukprot:NP_001118721.1 hypothetical protein AT3G27809 [Arabidopsis thaliana]
MKFHDDKLLFWSDVSPSYVGAEIVQPPEPATFPDLAREFQTPSPWLAI